MRQKYSYSSPSLEFARVHNFDPSKATDAEVTMEHILSAIIISADAIFDEIRGLRKDMAGEPSQVQERPPKDGDQNDPA